jgi:hypothetical protein
MVSALAVMIWKIILDISTVIFIFVTGEKAKPALRLGGGMAGVFKE